MSVSEGTRTKSMYESMIYENIADQSKSSMTYYDLYDLRSAENTERLISHSDFNASEKKLKLIA